MRPRWGVHLIGPLLVVVTSFGIWPGFAGAQGEHGDVSFGLYIGAVSVLLMAWSFILAVRIRALEPAFGGLDRMYRVHRWAGVAAVAAMYLHTSFADEMRGGVAGASQQFADAGEELAGLAQNMLYVLVAISLLRLVPYRWWRVTHKALGVPFAFAGFHVVTITKPFANTSVWGWYVNALVAAGLVAWLWRVFGRDVFAQGHDYQVVSSTMPSVPSGAATSPVTSAGLSAGPSVGPTTSSGDADPGRVLDLRLMPCGGRRLRHRVGQFAFVRLDRAGMREPHPFTIASPPGADELRFVIRDLGDWTARLGDVVQVGDRVRVEGPYGRFRPLPGRARPTVWIAGGVGITPFLAALEPARRLGVVPRLVYVVRREEEAIGLEELRDAARSGHLELQVVTTARAGRPTAASMGLWFGVEGVGGAHVALCGPAGLVRTMGREATAQGAHAVEHEEFDIRSGVGPVVDPAAVLRRPLEIST